MRGVYSTRLVDLEGFSGTSDVLTVPTGFTVVVLEVLARALGGTTSALYLGYTPVGGSARYIDHSPLTLASNDVWHWTGRLTLVGGEKLSFTTGGAATFDAAIDGWALLGLPPF